MDFIVQAANVQGSFVLIGFSFLTLLFAGFIHLAFDIKPAIPAAIISLIFSIIIAALGYHSFSFESIFSTLVNSILIFGTAAFIPVVNFGKGRNEQTEKPGVYGSSPTTVHKTKRKFLTPWF